MSINRKKKGGIPEQRIEIRGNPSKATSLLSSFHQHWSHQVIKMNTKRKYDFAFNNERMFLYQLFWGNRCSNAELVSDIEAVRPYFERAEIIIKATDRRCANFAPVIIRPVIIKQCLP